MYKLQKFSQLKGETPEEKLTLWSNGRPIYTQLKYNGIQMRLLQDGRMLTRDNKEWDMARFSFNFYSTIKYVLGQLPYTTFYGEFMVLNKSLQETAGLLSVNGKEAVLDHNLRYQIFDAALQHNYSFSKRIEILKDKLKNTGDFIEIARTTKDTVEEADMNYGCAIDLADMEGVVYRCDPCWHTAGVSADAVKRKRLHSMEGKCVAVREGEGKRRGMLGAMTLELPNGQLLNVGGGPGMTDSVLEQLYARPPIGQQVTFTYEELSKAGIPMRGQWTAVRNYE